MGCDIEDLIFLLLLWSATNTQKAIKQKYECRHSFLKLPAIGCHTDSIISLCVLCCRRSQIRARRLNIFCVFQEHLLAYHHLRTNLPTRIRNATNTCLYQESRHVAGAQHCLETNFFFVMVYQPLKSSMQGKVYSLISGTEQVLQEEQCNGWVGSKQI